MQVMTPDRHCVQVDGLTGRRYDTDRRGRLDMAPRDAKALLADGGFLPSLAGVTARSTGYRCDDCGFGALFTTCGRCGGTCSKES